MTRPLKSCKRLTQAEGRALEVHIERLGFSGCAGWLGLTPAALDAVRRCGPAKPEIVDRVRERFAETEMGVAS